MTVLQLIQDYLFHGREFVGERELPARRQEKASVGMNASAEVEVRAGEIVAIAIAEYAELEGGEERNLNGAGEGGG